MTNFIDLRLSDDTTWWMWQFSEECSWNLAAKQQLDRCKIPSDGTLIFWYPWSNKSEWWPSEWDNPWNLLFISYQSETTHEICCLSAELSQNWPQNCKLLFSQKLSTKFYKVYSKVPSIIFKTRQTRNLETYESTHRLTQINWQKIVTLI